MRSACTSTDPVSLYATPVTRPDSMRTTCWLSTKYRSQHGMCPAMGVYHPPTYHLSPPTRALESTPLTHRHHRKHTQTPTQASTYWTPSATQKQLRTGASAWRGIIRSYDKTESRLWSTKKENVYRKTAFKKTARKRARATETDQSSEGTSFAPLDCSSIARRRRNATTKEFVFRSCHNLTIPRYPQFYTHTVVSYRQAG